MNLPLENPKPDIEEFRKVILREKEAERVHFVELFCDHTILDYVWKNHFKEGWLRQAADDQDGQKSYWLNNIEFQRRMGYDYIRVSGGLDFPKTKRRIADDTHQAGRERHWVEEGTGPIASWQDFEEYPWPDPEASIPWHYEYVAENLPEGMGMFVCPTSGFLEVPMNELMGFENMAMLMFDDPKLVEAVFDRTAGLIKGFYNKCLGLKHLAGIFQGDDMGFKTSTMISPDDMRKLVFPHHRELSRLAHDNKLLYMLHACGNLEEVMPDLLDDIKIDAKHSYEDAIMPVAEAKKKYGNRMGILGGVDLDKLCRLGENDLRKHVRDILDACMPGGGYALGSGNSVANYVPVENYMIMMDEGIRYSI
jgi:uroporphyrinogen decarboxylase